jgi:hypothetical protein
MLRLELEVLTEENFDLDLLGFDEKQLAEDLAQEAPTPAGDPDVVPELRGDPRPP